MVKYLFVLTAILASTCAYAQGPSFNCRYAKAPDEIAIGDNQDLAVLDLEMANLYHYRNSSGYVGDLEDGQRKWLASRHGRGASHTCLHRAYIDQLQDLASGSKTRMEFVPGVLHGDRTGLAIGFTDENGQEVEGACLLPKSETRLHFTGLQIGQRCTVIGIHREQALPRLHAHREGHSDIRRRTKSPA